MSILVDSSSTLLQHSKQVLFSSVPFPMGVCESVGEKCNWQFLATVFLWQLSSTGIIWGICVYYVAFGRIWVVMDRCFYQSTFQGIECCVVTWSPGKICIMKGKGCDGFCYPSRTLDELAVVTNKAKVCPYLFNIFWGFISLITAVLEGNGFIPVLLRTWPKYWIYLVKEWPLLNFKDSSASQSCGKLAVDGPSVLVQFCCR